VTAAANAGAAGDRNFTRQLEVYNDLFGDARHRSATPQLVKLTIMARIRQDPDLYYLDKVHWDLNTPLVMCEVYATRVVQDLDLSSRDGIYIAIELRKRVQAARQLVAEGKLSTVTLDPERLVRKEKVRLPNVVGGKTAEEYLARQRKLASEPHNDDAGAAATPEPAEADEAPSPMEGVEGDAADEIEAHGEPSDVEVV